MANQSAVTILNDKFRDFDSLKDADDYLQSLRIEHDIQQSRFQKLSADTEKTALHAKKHLLQVSSELQSIQAQFKETYSDLSHLQLDEDDADDRPLSRVQALKSQLEDLSERRMDIKHAQSVVMTLIQFHSLLDSTESLIIEPINWNDLIPVLQSLVALMDLETSKAHDEMPSSFQHTEKILSTKLFSLICHLLSLNLDEFTAEVSDWLTQFTPEMFEGLQDELMPDSQPEPESSQSKKHGWIWNNVVGRIRGNEKATLPSLAPRLRLSDSQTKALRFSHTFRALVHLQCSTPLNLDIADIENGDGVLYDRLFALLPHGPVWALAVMMIPIYKRFRYMFEGPRLTNRLDKPQWIFTWLLNTIKEQELFLDLVLQPLFDECGLLCISAREEFIRGIVHMTAIVVRNRLHRIVTSEDEVPGLFEQTINELLGFELSLQDCYGYKADPTAPLPVEDESLNMVSLMMDARRVCEGRVPALPTSLMILQDPIDEATSSSWSEEVDEFGKESDEELDESRGSGSDERDDESDVNDEMPSGPRVTLSPIPITYGDKWFMIESQFTQHRYKEILSSPTAWQPVSFSSSASGLEQGSDSSHHLKPVECVSEFCLLLESIADRYSAPLPPAFVLRFFSEIQLPLIDRFVAELEGDEEALEINARSSLTTLRLYCRHANAAHYFIQVLMGWGEHDSFLRVQFALMSTSASLMDSQADDSELEPNHQGEGESSELHMASHSLFDPTIARLKSLTSRMSDRLAGAVTASFKADTRLYRSRKTAFVPPLSMPSTRVEQTASGFLDDILKPVAPQLEVSSDLCDALAFLTERLTSLEATLSMDVFTRVWRESARVLNLLLFEEIVPQKLFTDASATLFAFEMKTIVSVFRQWTKRPEGYFRALKEACIVLTLPIADAKALVAMLEEIAFMEGDKKLVSAFKETIEVYGVYILDPNQVQTILGRRTDIRS